jgi:hypothetical protein
MPPGEHPPRETTFLPETGKAKSFAHPDTVRLILALLLALTFLATIGGGFWGALLAPAKWADVKDWLQVVLPAVTAVVSTAIGFYFGTQQKQG